MRKLTARFPGQLAVIGVESPKYPAEGVPGNVRNAVQRNEIDHPVVVDPDHVVWDAYAVRAWPTLIFVSPSGTVIGRHEGEAPAEALATVVGQLAERYAADGTLRAGPLDLHVQSEQRPDDELAYPGGILATPERLFIADSAHNRVVMADLEGRVREVVGSGRPGFEDGSFNSAAFHQPHGMALDDAGTVLYVADTENHAVRAIHLNEGSVRTVAGTGEQSYRAVRSGPALATPLSSPWDVVAQGGGIIIAMAGRHQTWRLDLGTDVVSVWAGTGHEGIRDGSLMSSWLAQPMGLSAAGDVLYVSCAETQALRAVDPVAGTVTSVVGHGLFDFGDVDGPLDRALFQHNQGVAADGAAVYVADTYNNAIKRVDLDRGAVTTMEVRGLDEPSALSLLGRDLYVADTNNHRVVVVDVQTEVPRELELSGLKG